MVNLCELEWGECFVTIAQVLQVSNEFFTSFVKLCDFLRISPSLIFSFSLSSTINFSLMTVICLSFDVFLSTEINSNDADIYILSGHADFANQ